MDENYVYSRVYVLTGGIGSGKSTVASIFTELGSRVVCADRLAHLAVSPGSEALDEIRMAFGPKVFTGDGLDRRALGKIVFNDDVAKSKLESIIHPCVQKLALESFTTFVSDELKTPIIYDCPLFFETNLRSRPFRGVVVVHCSLELRVERLGKRDGLSRDEIMQRISSQLPLEQKVLSADYLLENNSSLNDLRVETKKVYELLLADYADS